MDDFDGHLTRADAGKYFPAKAGLLDTIHEIPCDLEMDIRREQRSTHLRQGIRHV